MKSILTRRLPALLLALLLLSGLATAAFAQTNAGTRGDPEDAELLMISGVTVTPESLAGYFAEDDSFSYDFDQKCLTLRGVINGGPSLALYSSVKGLTIRVEQDAQLKSELSDTVLLEGNTTLTGPGQLTVLAAEESSATGLRVANQATLILEQCKLTVQARENGLAVGEGGAGLILRGSTVHVTAGTGAAVDGFDGGIWLVSCAITAPAGGLVDCDVVGRYGIYDSSHNLVREVQIAPTQTTWHTLSFVMNGHGRPVGQVRVEHGQPADRPANPSEEGWVFGGWFTDPDCTLAYSFASPVNGDLVLYARWTADNNPFTDVKKKHYYYNAVLWAYCHEPQITGGTDETHFSPKQTCTREQVVTFLYAAKGKPELTGENNPFRDVKKKHYFYNAVLWAVSQGVTSGVETNRFGVGQPCTRAQVVTFLWAAEGKPEPADLSSPFTDVKRKDYFYKAVLWARERGITSGVDATHFGSHNPCTRADVVMFLCATYG